MSQIRLLINNSSKTNKFSTIVNKETQNEIILIKFNKRKKQKIVEIHA
jgi:hypothetical protein